MENASTTEVTDIATLPPAERALIVLNSSKTELKLIELRDNAAEIQVVTDKVGRELAHRVAMDLRSARTTIEKTGKAARDDATKFSKAVIDEEKRLIAMVEGEEKRVLALRDAYDAQVAAEKAAKEAAEKARKDEILSKIEGIRRLPLDLAGGTAEVIAYEVEALAAFVPSEDVFGEYTDEANAALKEALEAINALHAKTVAQEQAAAIVEQERVRLAEAEKAAQEALAAEREALELEKAALAAERAELEELRALKAAQQAKTQEPELTGIDLAESYGSYSMPVQDIPEEKAINLDDVLEAAAPIEIAQAMATAPVDFTIRQAALHTADQFNALADKVEACGVGEFAQQLRAVAYGLREGDHDAKIAAADRLALVEADERLLNATVNAIDNITQGQAAA